MKFLERYTRYSQAVDCIILADAQLGGVCASASPSRTIERKPGLLLLSLAELRNEGADIVRQFPNVKLDVFSGRGAEHFTCIGID